jgi:hypothetical protein
MEATHGISPGAATTTKSDDTDSDIPDSDKESSNDSDASTISDDKNSTIAVSTVSTPSIWEFLTKQAHANAGVDEIPLDIGEAVKKIYWPYVKNELVEAFCLIEAIKEDEIGETIVDKVASLQIKYNGMEDKEAIEKALGSRKHAVKAEIFEAVSDLNDITDHD